EDYGNPSSLHKKGYEAEGYIRQAREEIGSILKCAPNELIFTSGGTESNNMAILGTALNTRRRGKHIITSSVEHASVSAVLQFLEEEEGYEVTRIPSDSKGVLRLDCLEDAIRPDTVLATVMMVNNEIGTIQPLKEISDMIRRKNPGVVFHVDAIQAFGKLRVRPRELGAGLLSTSSHKFHGPKGTGFLYCSSGVRLHPIIFGGGQQKGMRSGTENVPGVAGMGLAAKLAYQDFEEKQKKLNSLRRYFLEGLKEIEGVSVNGWDETVDEGSVLEKRAPHIVSVSVRGVRSEVLLHALEEKGVYVSAGSACSSNHPSVSGTLKAIGLPKELLDSTVRFSFQSETTQEELRYSLDCMKELLPVLRRFSRK
ncbi:MAG: cysteine desulfurase, partial [Parasporobacterium sp.]|nr:cysteine desulfurase [Parasporobacterium sp.]